eukprot:PhM_4_TR19085/c1_g1_i3/m.96424
MSQTIAVTYAPLTPHHGVGEALLGRLVFPSCYPRPADVEPKPTLIRPPVGRRHQKDLATTIQKPTTTTTTTTVKPRRTSAPKNLLMMATPVPVVDVDSKKDPENDSDANVNFDHEPASVEKKRIRQNSTVSKTSKKTKA